MVLSLGRSGVLGKRTCDLAESQGSRDFRGRFLPPKPTKNRIRSYPMGRAVITRFYGEIAWWTLACMAGHLGMEIFGLVRGLMNAGDATMEDIIAMLAGEFLGMIADSIGMGACGKFAMAVISAAGSLGADISGHPLAAAITKKKGPELVDPFGPGLLG